MHDATYVSLAEYNQAIGAKSKKVKNVHGKEICLRMEATHDRLQLAERAFHRGLQHEEVGRDPQIPTKTSTRKLAGVTSVYVKRK